MGNKLMRDACSSFRNSDLQARIHRPFGPREKVILVILLVLLPSVALAMQYELLMSQDDELCHHVVDIYNADTKKYGHIKYDTHEEYNWIKWRDMTLYVVPSGYPNSPPMAISAKIAVFDINNDLSNEAIVHDVVSMSNNLVDSYTVYKAESIHLLEATIDASTNGKIMLFNIGSIPVDVTLLKKSSLKKISPAMQHFVAAAIRRNDKYEYFVEINEHIRFLSAMGKYYVVVEGRRSVNYRAKYSNAEHYGMVVEYKTNNSPSCVCLYSVNGGKLSRKGEN